MKYALIVFSGTGNSMILAQYSKIWLQNNGHEAEIIELTNGFQFTSHGYNAMYLYYPVLAMACPITVLKWLRKMQKISNMDALIMSTHGELDFGKNDGHPGMAPNQPINILKKKGFRILGATSFQMPHNVTAIFNGQSAISCQNSYQKTKSEVFSFLDEISTAMDKYALSEEKLQPILHYKRGNIFLRILYHTMFFLFSFLGRHFISQMFTSDHDCNGCSICAKKCPISCIKMRKDVPVWSWNCQACLKCYNTCPQNAIQISWIRLFWLFLLSVFPGIPLFLYTGSLILSHIPFLVGIIPFLNVCFILVLYYLQARIVMIITSPLIRVIDHTEFARKLNKRGFFKSKRRYNAYPFVKSLINRKNVE